MDRYISLPHGRAGVGGADALMNGTLSTSVFFLHKGPFVPDSRYPSALATSIDVRTPSTIVCRNTGQARWLATPVDGTEFGVVKLGSVEISFDCQS
jgi:hypothetical protein